jgi:predicted RNase H-like nuclease (RuvC/YqgF family)
MARDLRKLFEKEREEKRFKMKEGHEDRFFSKLDRELPKDPPKKKVFSLWMQIAASVVVAVGLSFYYLNSNEGPVDSDEKVTVVDRDTPNIGVQGISLGDLSPDLKKIETYYTTNINLQLSELAEDPGNKELVDSYMDRLAELNKEYQRLNQELNELGPNDQTINALINNLQLRLQLLQKLKTKLNQLKSSKNEQESSNIV